MSEAAVPSAVGASAPGPAAPAGKPLVPAWKLLAVLGGGGAVAGLLLVVAYLLTIEPIRAHKAQVLAEGVREVLALAPDAPYEERWWSAGTLVTARPAGAEDSDRIWFARGADGTTTGWAVVAEGNGFADKIRLIFGWDPVRGRLLALKVLENKETPGLGDAIGNDPAFRARFADRAVTADAPLKGVKIDSTPNAPHEVDTITGATVSSRAVIRIVNTAVKRWSPAVAAAKEAVR